MKEMNIMFFMTPKSEVAYTTTSDSMAKLMALMDRSRFTAIPVLDEKGRYTGTITEGDLLRQICSFEDWKTRETDKIRVEQIRRRRQMDPVRADADIEDLIQASMKQNFVPVTDDDGVFIGIITRKAIIEYCYQHSSIRSEDR